MTILSIDRKEQMRQNLVSSLKPIANPDSFSPLESMLHALHNQSISSSTDLQSPDYEKIHIRTIVLAAHLCPLRYHFSTHIYFPRNDELSSTLMSALTFGSRFSSGTATSSIAICPVTDARSDSLP